MNGSDSIMSPRAWKSWVAPSAIIVSGTARCAWTAPRLPKEYPSVRPPVATDASIFWCQLDGGCRNRGCGNAKFRVFSVGVITGQNIRGNAGGVSHGNGACGATENGGDCATDSQNAWPMAPPRHSLATCIAMCRCCERCRYISYSAQSGGCSWFAACQMGGLVQPTIRGTSNHYIHHRVEVH